MYIDIVIKLYLYTFFYTLTQQICERFVKLIIIDFIKICIYKYTLAKKIF